MLLIRIPLVAVLLALGLGLLSVCGQEPEKELLNRFPATARAGLPGLQPNNQVLLPNGWSLTPQGEQIQMGDFPVHIEIDPSGDFAAVLHCGYGDHEIRMVAIKQNQVVSTAKVDQSFFGMAFSSDGSQLAVSGGEDERVYLFSHSEGYLGKPEIIQLGTKDDRIVVSGIAFLEDRRLAICGMLSDQLIISAEKPGQPVGKAQFAPQSFPYSICIDRAKNAAYVSLWGKSQIAKVDLGSMQVAATFETHSHPTEMVLLDDGKFLAVACSDQNSVVIIDTAIGRQVEVLQTAMYPKAANGSTPSSIAISPDGGVLAVANADNNNIALFDIRERNRSSSLGFIPVGWYPTSVRFSKAGQSILVTNGKGLTSRANPQGANPNVNPPKTTREYIGGLFQGTLSIIDTPDPAELVKMTRQTLQNSPLESDQSPRAIEVAADNPIPRKVGDKSPLKHCVYIIKENRTYDQVFGDMPKGNGDPSLCIFPEDVTPNQHSLASQFVLLDNFYVESEVSADGHEWTMAAYATDFVEKTWPLTYRGGRKKLSYPAEGKFKIAEPSSGYFWDKCREKGVSYFSFGEFIDNGPTPADPATTKVESLQGHFDPLYRSYDLDYSDILRAKRFIEKWTEFEQAGTLPQFIVVRLPNDHTYGTRVGKLTPTAMVAENDLALGMIVQALSQSKSWKETAIFVVQDDAQNGADHVDAHRTVALAISPYSRLGTVDSTMYSTSSMLRTMGLILGLDPMTQFDAAATPMYRCFQSRADLTHYSALMPKVDLQAKNDIAAWGAKQSEELDLTEEDAADDLLFGDIVWRSVRGADHPMPAPVRAAFVFPELD